MTRGRHNFKMGMSLEYNRKTEPGSADYMGNFNFGHDANNPLSTGNGYANMLLGVFTTYTELTSRVDRDVRHWQNDFYFQDNWRITPRLTVDLGLRVQHSGSDFEINNMNSGFFADQWQREQRGPRLSAGLHDRRARQSGLRGGQPARDRPGQPGRLPPDRLRRQHRAGLGPAAQRHHHRRHRRAEGRDLLHVPVLRLRAARGLGLERHRRRQDGAAQRRGGSSTTSRDRPGDGGYPFSGGCPVSCTRQIRWARFGDITAATPPNLIENPVNVTVGGYEQPLSKSHNVNIAFQRDIGFNTVAEIAYVGNYTWNHGRFVDDNRLPLYVYGNPANLVNNAPVTANSLRYQYGQYPGMGSANLYVPGLYAKTLQYNAMQLQRRAPPDQRAADGLLVHARQGRRLHRLRPLHRRDRRRSGDPGPLLGTDQRRSPAQRLGDNWSYDVPTFTDMPVIKQLLRTGRSPASSGC